MKKIRNIIIVLVAFIIILIAIINLVKFNKVDDTQQQDVLGEDIEDIPEITNEIANVTSNSKFNTVQQCIQQYYNVVNNKSTSFYSQDEYGNYIQIISDEDIDQLRLNLLSEEYISRNDINLNNIDRYITIVDESVIVVALKMKELINVPIEKYVVYGVIINLDYEVLDDFYIYVNLDTKNSTFSIEPITNNYNSIEEISFENTNQTIEVNDANQYKQIIFSYEDTARAYFSVYKKIILSAPQILYNYLDAEYRESRFGSLEEFEKYIEKNQEEILGAQLKKYLVNNYSDYNEFVCMDQYQNLYIFDETNPMDFTLKLDTYTIPTENFTTTYQSASTQDKVMMNVDKWVQMLNNRDYTAAYNVLNETFRNNTFGSEEKFEAVMREKLPLHYAVEYNKFSEEGKTYLLDITLTDITQKSEDSISISIFMQLNDDLDFVMSFSIE